MIIKKLAKGIVLCSMASFLFVGVGNAGEKTTKPSKQEAAKLALLHQTNGNKYDDNGQLKEAIDEYRQSLEYVADDTNTLFNLAVVYLKVNKPADAAAALEKVVKIATDDTESYNLLGIAYRGCGRETEAKKAWETSLKINQDQPKIKAMMDEKVDSVPTQQN